VASEVSASATAELRHSRHELHRPLSDDQQRWLADLYRANASAVYFVCKFLLRKPDEAADATQEVFLRAAESLRGRTTAQHARSWLLTAAQNHCLNLLRTHSRVDKTRSDPIADPRDDADPETAIVDRALITAVLGELRVRERRALLLWAVEQRPLAQIAHDLGISYTAVQQLLFRARRHAASVAARVAAVLLGLLQLGRAARRASQAGQLVLVAVTVPVVLASLPLSSNANHAVGSPPSNSAVVRSAPAAVVNDVRAPRTSAEKTTLVVAPGLQVPGAPVSLSSVSIEGASTISGLIAKLERTVETLGLPPTPPTLPNKGGGNLVP
jgi:RNA polymerase sigma-70 factor (ECF subfamily)